MSIKESEIRDALGGKLEILETGLQLIEIEKYLPNSQGTRGFVDLFARDAQGKYVLIEIKRSSSTSREALHEVLKYLEAVKIGMSVRDAEIRIFIVSTDWSELLVPFSSFVSRTSCETSGFLLEVDARGMPTTVAPVTPIKLTEDRLFSPWHELNLYETAESLESGLKTYEASCAAKAIENFVLLVMVPPPGYHEWAIEATQKYAQQLGESFGESGTTSRGDIGTALTEYKYLVYFATLRLPVELCWRAIRSGASAEDLQEFESFVSEQKGEALACLLHEKVYEVLPNPSRDYYEIGYPAKFGNKLLEDEGWTIREVRRFGTLRENSLLTDEAIVEDLRGNDGASLQKYGRRFSLSNPAEISEVRAGVRRCLRDNPIWRNQVLRVLDEFLPIEPGVDATLFIFNPANFCLALYLSLTQANGWGFIPQYRLQLKKDGIPISEVFGGMRMTGNDPSFSNLLRKHYNGKGINFLRCLGWGGYESSDVQIALDLGMAYRTFKVDSDKDTATNFWELTEFGWVSSEPSTPFSGFQQFVESYPAFVQDVCEYYAAHWDGVMYTVEPGEIVKFRS